MSSKQPNLTVRLAAAHLRILELEGDPIDREASKKMAPEFINSLFAYDHYPVAEWFDGCDHPSNLRPRLTKAHRHKTATIDIPAIAKGKRIMADNEVFRRKMLAKSGRGDGEPAAGKRAPKKKWGSKPMDYRKFNGDPVRGGSRKSQRTATKE